MPTHTQTQSSTQRNTYARSFLVADERRRSTVLHSEREQWNGTTKNGGR